MPRLELQVHSDAPRREIYIMLSMVYHHIGDAPISADSVGSWDELNVEIKIFVFRATP